jgi:hypothetical protein
VVGLGNAAIGNEYMCSIQVTDGAYVFNFNNKQHIIPRALKNKTATGFLLYPYFGGDETAPHEIRIFIRH